MAKVSNKPRRRGEPCSNDESEQQTPQEEVNPAVMAKASKKTRIAMGLFDLRDPVYGAGAKDALNKNFCIKKLANIDT